MAKKGENIYKRRDGRWEARYVKGYDLDGKIRYGFCYGKTYREAKDKVTLAKAACMLGIPERERPESRRFYAYCAEWLKLRKETVKPATYVKYEAIINKHLLPKFGGFYPQDITSAAAEDLKQELLKKGLAAKTVRDILTVLRTVLRFTAKQFPNSLSPVEVTYPRESHREIRVLSREEQLRFSAYLLEEPDPCRIGVLLALLTGMRIGELCALRWKDVSLKDMTIRVVSTMQRLKDTDGGEDSRTKVIISAPKTERSMRLIPLTERAAALCRMIYSGDGEAYVLSGTMHYVEPRTLQYRFSRYAQACGLEGVHFHTMRHTFATRCVEVGFEIKSLSEILGHASTTITLDLYVHSSMEMKRENMNKLVTAGL